MVGVMMNDAPHAHAHAHACLNCNAYASFYTKDGQPNDTLKWIFYDQNADGGYFERVQNEDDESDVLAHPCMNCAKEHSFQWGGIPYYGMEYVKGENGQPVKHFITLDEFADHMVHLFEKRQTHLPESYTIEDWCASCPSTLQQTILDIWYGEEDDENDF